MKKTLAGFVLLSAVLLSGASASSFETFEVTFYDGDPARNGEVLAVVDISTASVTSAVDEDAVAGFKYLTIRQGSETYTFKTFPGGSSKYNISLNGGELDRSDATTLAEMLDLLAAQETNQTAPN